MDTVPTPQPPKDATMGAALIGVVIAGILYGISIVQSYIYFSNPHSSDGWHLKTLVALVLVFDTVHQLLITHSIYRYLVTDYWNHTIANGPTWSLLTEVLFNGFNGLLVQSFLTHRVYKLANAFSVSKRNWFVAAPAIVLVAAEFGCVTAFGIMALVKVSTFEDLATMKWLSILVNSLAAAGDVYIAAALCWLLTMSKTGFARSDTIIKKLILFAVNTGALTSLCAVASLVSIVAAPNTFIYIAFFFSIGRLYANSLLATLNARRYIRNSADEVEEWNSTSGCGGLFGATSAGVSVKNRSRSSTRPGIAIQIDTTQQIDLDVEKGMEMQMQPHCRDHDRDRDIDESGSEVSPTSRFTRFSLSLSTPTSENRKISFVVDE